MSSCALSLTTQPIVRNRRICRSMTRCECAAVAFAEVAAQMTDHALSLQEVQERTGCGQTCTACIPDLVEFLTARECLGSL